MWGTPLAVELSALAWQLRARVEPVEVLHPLHPVQ